MAAPHRRATRQETPASPPARPAKPLCLADLPPGRRATVIAVALDGPEAERLLDLGFVPGTRVDVLARAPLGDPTVYRLRGSSFCLRRTEARRIAVRPA